MKIKLLKQIDYLNDYKLFNLSRDDMINNLSDEFIIDVKVYQEGLSKNSNYNIEYKDSIYKLATNEKANYTYHVNLPKKYNNYDKIIFNNRVNKFLDDMIYYKGDKNDNNDAYNEISNLLSAYNLIVIKIINVKENDNNKVEDIKNILIYGNLNNNITIFNQLVNI
jgi:hypothetical protein